jgi:hypothetical protein
MASKPLFQRNTFIYLVARPPAETIGYDEYESFVVVASSGCEPRWLHPAGDKVEYCHEEEKWVWADDGSDWGRTDWPSTAEDMLSLEVRCIGRARHGYESGLILCSSFNAG